MTWVDLDPMQRLGIELDKELCIPNGCFWSKEDKRFKIVAHTYYGIAYYDASAPGRKVYNGDSRAAEYALLRAIRSIINENRRKSTT